ncbi:hypothetical protein acdb102_33880 [Acidothermaceae bacterium B102]|nr:hypothetical protein acdb102_33880 [Acidothermaceae bacterium B102]
MNEDAAARFMTLNARLLDRLRYDLLLDRADPQYVLAALAAYRNPDGGYGWGLEPDLRSRGSQPVGAMHALEVMAETAASADQGLLGWLERHTLPDGGLPFALPIGDPVGCATHWVGADPAVSSLQMTSQVVANARRVGVSHPWVTRATRYCLDAIDAIDSEPHAYELTFVLHFLDAVEPGVAEPLVDRLRRWLSPDGSMAVTGGIEGERLLPLDFSPFPDTPSRRLFTDEAISRDLVRLAARQQVDGGWPVDFGTSSPAAALEWRGYATVQAVAVLRANAARPAPAP